MSFYEDTQDEEEDDLCDRCMRSMVSISHIDEEGNTVCFECAEDDPA